nr:retrovirus-related Pol polyprotein from transposon TNT 1-94 [Tanacetum cinerariifolium]
VIPTTSVGRPQLKNNPHRDRVLCSNSRGKKLEVEEHRRNVKLSKNKTSVTACNDSLNAKTLNVKYVFAICAKCAMIEKHDVCVLNSVAKPLKKIVASESNKKPRNNVRKLHECFGKIYKWSYIKFTPSGYMWKPKSPKGNVNPNERSNLGMTKLHLFLDMEIWFKDLKSTCFIRDLKGNDLLTGSRGTDLYSITLQDLNYPNPICLMAKATSSQVWLWHRHLSHLNFDTINLLSKNDIVVGLPKLKFVKDHLCSSSELEKAKRKSFYSKLTPSSKRRLHLLYMDLCGPIRVGSINGKRYVLVIMDDYSRYTWTHFLRSKDETPEVLIDFLRLVQRGLQAQVRVVRTDKGTEFLNQTLHAYFATEGIRHQTSIARTPEQNGVIERRNLTLVEAARTMLSAAKVPLFFWAEAIATASDELIKSSVENLVPNPSESEDLSNIGRRSEGNLFEPSFDEEIISIKIDPHHFNAESDLIESLLNQDSLIISSPKIDSLLKEFSGELAHIDLISPGINEADFDHEEEIRLVEKFDSLMEEIDIFLAPDDSIPSGIKNDEYDSEGDILFLEELLRNDSHSLPENESFHFDAPSSPHPPAKPPNDDEIEPNTGLLTTKVVTDIQKKDKKEAKPKKLMSTQQDIYAAGSESRPPMLNKENYVPWSSRLLRYDKSRPNGKLIYNSIINGPYARRMIPKPGDTNREPEWSRHVTIVHQTKDLRTADYTQLYDYLKYNQKERISSNPRNRQIAQPGMNMGQDRQMQMVGGNGENQFRQYAGQNVWNLNGYNAVQNVSNQVIQNVAQNPRVQNIGNQNGSIGVPGNANQNLNGNGNLVAARAEGNAAGRNGNQIRCYNCRGVGHFSRNYTVRPIRRDVAYLHTQLLIAQKEEAGIQLQAEEFDLMAAAADLDEIEEVNANCILMANLQQASTSGTQTDKAPVYDSDGSAEVYNYENYDDNEIFNMFTQEEQYTELLEPIPKPHQVPQNDNNIISEDSSVEQSGKIVEQHPANFEETRALYDSLYQNLAIEVEKVNTVNFKLKETNAELTTELARFKNQEKCLEISQEKYDKLERCYQQSVYQEQCLSKKINALHLSSGKQIMTLNEELSDLNKQLLKEKSIVSFLLEEKKKLKSDFKTREDELLDKQIQLEKKIKELDNILVKTGQSIQTIHMLSPKPDRTENGFGLSKSFLSQASSEETTEFV